MCKYVCLEVEEHLVLPRCIFGNIIMHTSLCVNVHSSRCDAHTHSLYLVSCSQQVISHLVQVGGLACVDEAHHLFEDIWLHVIYLHTVLNG